jgi:Flp pilus assembly pilin Flp
LQCDRMPSKHRPAGMQGQSLAEYGMVMGLVAIVGIAAVALLGGNIQDVLASINGGNAAPSTLSVSNTPPGAPSSSGNSGIGGIVPPPGKGQQQVCFQNGICANIPVINSSTTITAGSNGAQLTYRFADVLGQIARQLEADPNADPNLYGLLADLANKSKTLGAEEKILFEENCNLGCGASSLNTPMLQPTVIAYAEFQAVYSDLAAALQSNPNALPPELKNLVLLEAEQINQIYIQSDVPSIVRESGLYVADEMNITLTNQSVSTLCNYGGANVCV